MHGAIKGGIVAAAVVGTGAAIWGLTKLGQSVERDRKESFAKLPEPARAAVTRANQVYDAAKGSSLASSMGAAAAMQLSTPAADVAAQFNAAYDVFPGSAAASGIAGAAALLNDWDAADMGELSKLYNEARGAAQPSAILAVVAKENGLTAAQVNDLYDDINATTAFGDAILVDAAARHDLSADEVERRFDDVDGATRTDGGSTAILTAAAIDAGIDGAAIGRIHEIVNREVQATNAGTAYITAAIARSGADPLASARLAESMFRHTSGTSDGTGAVLGAWLLQRDSPNPDMPVSQYAVEEDDDD